MMKRKHIVFLIICILSITALSLMYDLREYEEYNQMHQNKSLTVIHEVYNNSLFFINLTESITHPSYTFLNFQINEVFIREIRFSTQSELVYVLVYPHIGTTFSHGNMTPWEQFVVQNITLSYPIDYEYFQVFFQDFSSTLTSTNVTIMIDYVIDCTFQRPPKHTISGMILSLDMTTWVLMGAVIMAMSLFYISWKLVKN